MNIEFILFLILLTLVVFWSRLVKNWVHYRRKQKRWIFGSIILCRNRLIFAFEVFGVILLVIKLVSFSPAQSDYNELLAEVSLANVHSTSEIYRTLNRDLPFKLPDIYDTSQLDLPNKATPVDSKKVFEEVDKYIRKASALLGKYFGNVIPECKINGRPLRIISAAPDSEIVGIELSRIAWEQGKCDKFEIRPGMVKAMLSRGTLETRLELIGLIFILLAIYLRYSELKYTERKQRNPKHTDEWYWNEKNLFR